MRAVEIDTGSDSQTPLLELIADVCGLLDIEELRHGPMGVEAQALRLVALGRSNHHVAQALGISHRTVGKHLERGFRKLGVGDRSTASARVWELAGSSAERAVAQTAADLGNDGAGLSSVVLAEARA